MPAEPHDDERRERCYREGASSESSHDAEEHAVGERHARYPHREDREESAGGGRQWRLAVSGRRRTSCDSSPEVVILKMSNL